MRFSPKAAIETAVTNVFDLMAGHQRGDIVSWSAIVAVGGYRSDHPHYAAFIARLKKRVRKERNIVVMAAIGDGLKLLTVTEQIEVPIRNRHRRAARQYRRAAVELGCTPDALLTHHQQNQKLALMELAEAAAAVAHRSVCRVGRVVRPSTEAMPRAPIAMCVGG